MNMEAKPLIEVSQDNTAKAYKWISNSVPSYSCLVRLRILSSEIPQLNELLRVVPCTTRCIKKKSHQYTSNCTKHEIWCEDLKSRINSKMLLRTWSYFYERSKQKDNQTTYLGPQKRFARRLSNKSEYNTNRDRSHHAYKSRESHLSQRGLSYKSNTPLIIWFDFVSHDVWIFSELASHLKHHLIWADIKLSLQRWVLNRRIEKRSKCYWYEHTSCAVRPTAEIDSPVK